MLRPESIVIIYNCFFNHISRIFFIFNNSCLNGLTILIKIFASSCSYTRHFCWTRKCIIRVLFTSKSPLLVSIFLICRTLWCYSHRPHCPSHHHHPHHHHVPGLLQTSAIMAFQPSLSSVLLMSSLLGDSFIVTKLFRLPVYFVCCLPLLLVPQVFPLNNCFSSPSALFICQKNCRDILYPAISITSSFDFFSAHNILIVLLMYHISAASSLLSRSFVNVQHSHPYRRMVHNYVGFWSVDFGVNCPCTASK